MIPYGRQSVSEGDIASVVDTLRGDWLTQGPAVPRFEAAIAEYVGASSAIAVSSGTAALHLACLALGVAEGDIVWTSPITFVASANCARYCGAEVDFVDIDPRTYCLSPSALAEKLEAAESQGRLPAAVVAVHMTGQPCEMASFAELSRRYGFAIIEDAAHAIGATYRDSHVGDCSYSDLTTFSFHPVKIITTGEGGMVTTQRPELAGRLELLRTHGITRDELLMEGATDGPWYYEQLELGFNYRMTDIQAALGENQMKRIEAFLGRRREIAARYDEALAGLPLVLPWQHPDGRSAWHLYVIRVRPEARVGRREAFDMLRTAGIGVNVHYMPVHLQPYYRRLGFAPGDFPEAERYYAEAISLPMYPGLSEEEQGVVIAAVKEIFQ